MKMVKATMEDGDRAKSDSNIAAVKRAVTAATAAFPAGKFWLITKGYTSALLPGRRNTSIIIQETVFKAQWNCDSLDDNTVEATIQGLKSWVKDRVRSARNRRAN